VFLVLQPPPLSNYQQNVTLCGSLSMALTIKVHFPLRHHM
jgi:hypothetical protein